MKYFILILLCSINIFSSDIIPEDRRVPWTLAGPTTNQFVLINYYEASSNYWAHFPGIVPGTTNVVVGDGIVDDWTAIQTAFNNVPNGKTIKFDDATYRVSQELIIRGQYNNDKVNHNRTFGVFGSGTNTIFLSESSGNAIEQLAGAGENDWQIVSAYSTNLTTVTVATTENIPVGSWVLVTTAYANTFGANTNVTGNSITTNYVPRYMMATYEFDHNGNPGTGSGFGNMFRVVSKTANTITFHAPCPYLNFVGILISHVYSPCYQMVFDNFSVERRINKGLHNILLQNSQEPIVYRVESNRTRKWHIRLERTAGAYIQKCYVHDTFNDDPALAGGDSDYGIVEFDRSNWNTIIDNFAKHVRHAYGGEYAGGYGSVITLNASLSSFDEAKTNTVNTINDYMSNHGGNRMGTLIELNFGVMGGSDDTFGPGRKMTFHRNWFLGESQVSQNLNKRTLEIQRDNLSNNIVGNVLGIYGHTYSSLYWTNSTTSSGAIIRNGYLSDGDTDYLHVDTNVWATAINHMNWQAYSNTVILDPNISNTNLTSSYFFTAWPPNNYFINGWPTNMPGGTNIPINVNADGTIRTNLIPVMVRVGNGDVFNDIGGGNITPDVVPPYNFRVVGETQIQGNSILQ